MFGLFGSAKAANPDTFWNWFIANEERLFSFEQDREAIFDQVGKEMGKVDRDLTFEFGPVQNGKREFVISAGGLKKAFPAVEAMYGKAPTLQRWVWTKYRPRRPHINDLQFGGKTVQAKDVRYVLAEDGDKVGVVLFFDGYNEKEKATYGQIGYLFLDEALGEYAVETRVGFVEFQSRNSRHFSKSSPLKDLPAQFDDYWARKVH